MADYTKKPRITNSSKKGVCAETGISISKFESVLYVPEDKEVFCSESSRYKEFKNNDKKEVTNE